MRYRPFAKTGLYVSEICLGCMTFGGKGFWQAIGSLGSKQVESLVGTALEGGVNFIDTADVYSEGESEQLLGEALATLNVRREQVSQLRGCQPISADRSVEVIEKKMEPSAHRDRWRRIERPPISPETTARPSNRCIRARYRP